GLSLSIAGGVLGLALPALAGRLVERLVPAGVVAPASSSLDWPLLAFASAVSIATGLVFSLGPALQATRESTAEVLQQSARGTVGGRTRGFRDGLVVLQVAGTLVLLMTAGLMLRTLANLGAVDLGFEPDHLLTMQVALPQPKYAERDKRQAFFDRVIAAARSVPGVERAAFASTLPFQSIGNTRSYEVEGRAPLPGEIRDALYRVGTSDYLQALRVRLVEGRLIDERDRAGAPPAVVINATMARRYWPSQPATGH